MSLWNDFRHFPTEDQAAVWTFIVILMLGFIVMFVCDDARAQGGGQFYFDGADSVYAGGQWHYNSYILPVVDSITDWTRDTLKVEWLGYFMNGYRAKGDSIIGFTEYNWGFTIHDSLEIGLREDGVVVWRRE